MLMSGEGKDERKENALKTSLDLLDNFLSHQNYVSGDFLTIADFAILASTTQLEGMDYRLSGYRWVNQSSLGSTHLKVVETYIARNIFLKPILISEIYIVGWKN